jgi:hypothetical protein
MKTRNQEASFRRCSQAMAAALSLSLLLSLSVGAQSSRRQGDDDPSDDEAPISIMDSTDAQWGMRSVNDSVYQGYPMNAVYLERGRQRLPDSFPKYQPKKLGNEIMVRSSGAPAPSTIQINGVTTPLEKRL